jgi:hypothetical protein
MDARVHALQGMRASQAAKARYNPPARFVNARRRNEKSGPQPASFDND